jgi:ABC-type multidrug transport system permease subunit
LRLREGRLYLLFAFLFTLVVSSYGIGIGYTIYYKGYE